MRPGEQLTDRQRRHRADAIRAVVEMDGYRYIIEDALQQNAIVEQRILNGRLSESDYIRDGGYRAGLQYVIGAAERLIGQPQEGPTL